MWNDAQLHVSPTVCNLVPHVAPVENRRFIKPKWGFWTSTYDAERQSSAWVDWCLAEEFGDVTRGSWFVLTPDPAAHVFVIDTLPDLRYLVEHYFDPEALPYMRFITCLDFECLSQDFDAIHLTEAGQWATRHSQPHDLNGWDCECTLWFRWRFTSIVPVEKPEFVID